MAKLYGEIAAKALLTLDKSFARANGQPLDASEVYYSLAAAQEYAAGAQAYVGQKIVVIEDGVVTHYSVNDTNGTLKELGAKPVGDGTTISIANDGTISLANIADKAEGTYNAVLVNGTLTWVKPSETTVEGLSDLISALTGRVDGHDTAIEANANSIKAIADDYLKDADKTELSNAIAAEKQRAEGIEGGLRSDVDTIKSDYLKTADKYDDTALKNRVAAIEDDYLKAEDKYDDTDLKNRVSAIEGDYLKAEDIADMATDAEVADAIKVEADRAKGVEEGLQNQINLIMNNPDTENVINSISEFTQYIEEHGEIAEGFRTDIDANAEAIAGEIDRATKAEGVLSGRIDVLEAIDHDAYIDADTALKNELTVEINKKANSEDVNSAVGGLSDRLDVVEGDLAADGRIAQAIAAAESAAKSHAESKADAAKEAAIADAAGKYATTGALSSLETALDERLDVLEAYDHATYATKEELKSTDDKAVSNANAINNLTGRLDGIVAQGGEPNVINNIKVNGVVQTIADKTVDIAVPTKFSDLTDNSGFDTRINAAQSAAEGAQSTANSAAAAAAAAQGEVDALETEVGGIQTVVAGHTTSIGDHSTRISALEQADITHNTHYEDLKGIVNGHTSDIAKKADQTDLNAVISDVAGLGTAIDSINNVTIPAINAEIAKKADASALNNYYTKSEVSAIVGDLGEGKTLVEMIGEAQAAATYDDAEVRGLIADNTSAISAIYKAGEGEGAAATGILPSEIARVEGLVSAEADRAKSVEGDHEDRIAKMETFWAAADDPAGTVDKLAEIVSYIEADQSGALDMAADIQENAEAIAAIYKAGEGETPASGILVDEIARVEGKADANTTAIAAINNETTGILAQAKAYANEQIASIPVATAETLGLVKYDNDTIKMNESNQLYVAEVSTDVLVNGAEELILNGGKA